MTYTVAIINCFIVIKIIAEITVGLQRTSYSALETGGPFTVCAQLFVGNLERNVSLTLTSSDGNATGTVILFSPHAALICLLSHYLQHLVTIHLLTLG